MQKFDIEAFLTTANGGSTTSKYHENQAVFSQGESADSVFYLQSGKVRISVISDEGKEAIIAILEEGSFLGENCLTGHPLRIATATTMMDSVIVRLQKSVVIRLLNEERSFSEKLLTHMIERNARLEADLTDQLFNSTEKRLARVLLLMANYGKEGKPLEVIPNIDQTTLAAMIGATRPRVNHFMNKFKQLGFIEYNGSLKVHSSLLTVVLRD